jgi:hypothetical protein
MGIGLQLKQRVLILNFEFQSLLCSFCVHWWPLISQWLVQVLRCLSMMPEAAPPALTAAAAALANEGVGTLSFDGVIQLLHSCLSLQPEHLGMHLYILLLQPCARPRIARCHTSLHSSHSFNRYPRSAHELGFCSSAVILFVSPLCTST